MRGLLPQTAAAYCFADNVELCRRLLEAGAEIVQYRDKETADAPFRENAKRMQAMVREREHAVFIVNDRVDIALDIKADGVHVGQDDEDCAEVVRRAEAGMIVGVSVDTGEEAAAAERAGASYVGAGAVFPTPTKKDAVVIGVEGLKSVVDSVSIPVAAVGGISLENIGEAVAAGARYCGVISELNNAGDLPLRFREFSKAVEKSRLAQATAKLKENDTF